MPALLELRDVWLRLGGEDVLSGVNLAIEPGEIHALLGSNGAGKSSVAYAILGCEGYRPNGGEILFDGNAIGDLAIHERARRGITLAWQEPARFEGLPIRSYLAAGNREADAAALLRQVGLDPERYLNRPADRTLSGGERRRVELAAVVAMRPRLAMLDEPTAGIDLLSMDDVVRVIDSLKTNGAAVLLITHQEDVAAHAGRASQICGGRIVASGAVAEVIESYKTRRCRQCNGKVCDYA